MRRLLIPCLALTALILFTMSNQKVEGKEEKDSIKIGATAGITGKYAKIAFRNEWALTTAVQIINKNGGIHGRKVELFFEDDRSDPTEGMKIYERMITKQKIVGAIGPVGTAITLPVAGINEKYKIPMVSGTAATLELYKRGFKYHFGMFPFAGAYAPAIVETFKQLGPRPQKIALLTESTAWGKDITILLNDVMPRAGFKIVFHEDYDMGRTDFTAVLLKVKSTDPDILMHFGRGISDIAVVKQAAEIGFNTKGLVCSVSATPTFSAGVGDLANGVMSIPAWHETARFPKPKVGPLQLDIPEFIKAIRGKYGVEHVEYHVATAFASAQILFAGMQKAGEMSKGGEINPNLIRDGIAGLDMWTVLGRAKFNENGRNIYSTMIMSQWQKGKVVVIGPPDAAQKNAIYPKPAWKAK